MATSEAKRLYDIEYRKKNRERLNAMEVARRKKNHDRAKVIMKRSKIKTAYGISLEEYNQKLNEQDFKCAICGSDLSGHKKQQLDHDHETGAVRDFLCRNCNTALGGFQDSEDLLMRAVEYLKRHRQGELSSQ